MIHDVAIVGAGLSGLSAARYLVDHGLNVVLVEKSQGMGGRAATRRIHLPDGTVQLVDHGAQFFTARDPLFQEQVSTWLSQGVCFEWATGFHTWDGVSLNPPEPKWEAPRFACRGGMNSLGKNLAEGLQVIRDFTVSSVSLNSGVWVLHADSSASMEPIQARSLFCSAPAPQSLKLIGSYLSPAEHELLKRITFGSCLALMASFEHLPVNLAWKGIQVRDTRSSLSWIACDSSRRGEGECHVSLVMHATPEFSSREILSTPEGKETAAAEMLREASRIVGKWVDNPVSLINHLWRYAIPLGEGFSEGFLSSESHPPLYVIGDGLERGRIEGAWLSGLRGARHHVNRHQAP